MFVHVLVFSIMISYTWLTKSHFMKLAKLWKFDDITKLLNPAFCN